MSTRYTIEGMTCGGCVNAVTKALKRAGFEAQVDLASNSAEIDGTPDTEAVVRAVRSAGFEAKAAQQ